MRVRKGIFVGLLSCAALAAPAQAQNMDALRGHLALRDFARCTVKYEHELAKQVALGRGRSSMSDEELHRAFNSRCLGMWGVRLSGTSLAIRGALAEELVQRDLGRWPELNPAGLAPLHWAVPKVVKAGPGVERITPSVAQKAFEGLVRDSRVGRLGECVVRASPQRAVAVLNTKMDSKAELAALKALTPEITACVKAGDSPDFTGSRLRYALALSYYQLANASSAPAALASVGTAALSSEARSLQLLLDYGACVVAKSPEGARQVLAMDYRTPDYARKLKAISGSHGRCLVAATNFQASGILFAGALAEALLKTDFKPGELSARIAFNPAREAIQARGATEDMALCTALSAPQATAALFATEPATHEESEAMKPLGPVLGDCLKKGETAQLNKPAIRSMLALAAYRIATTPKRAAAQ